MCALINSAYYLDVDDEDDIIKEALASSEDASADENQKQRWYN